MNPCRNVLEIQEARAQCDTLIVFTHIGPEGHNIPSPRMKNLFHCFVQAGASAVINCHAHTIMGMEVFQNAPVYYGLGNLFFPGVNPMPDWWYRGILAELTITDDNMLSCNTIFTAFPGAHFVDFDKAPDAVQNMERLSGLLLDSVQVEEQWRSFCRNQRSHLLKQVLKGGAALGWCWLRRKLSGSKKWSNDHSIGARGARMFRGLLMCENHVDEFQQIFDDLMKHGL